MNIINRFLCFITTKHFISFLSIFYIKLYKQINYVMKMMSGVFFFCHLILNDRVFVIFSLIISIFSCAFISSCVFFTISMQKFFIFIYVYAISFISFISSFIFLLFIIVLLIFNLEVHQKPKAGGGFKLLPRVWNEFKPSFCQNQDQWHQVIQGLNSLTFSF